jgi:hypothetical protein
MKGNLNFEEFFFYQMEVDLHFKENGRWPQFSYWVKLPWLLLSLAQLSPSLLNLNLISHSFVFSAVIMSHQEPISMRDPKIVSVAAKVLPLHKHYLHSGPTSVPTFLRKNKSGIQQQESTLSRRGKETPFKPVKAIPTSKRKKHVGSTAQTKLFRNQVKKPKKFAKPKRRGRGRLTSSDLWRLNRLSHKFTKTMGRKGRERNNKVSKNLFNRLWTGNFTTKSLGRVINIKLWKLKKGSTLGINLTLKAVLVNLNPKKGGGSELPGRGGGAQSAPTVDIAVGEYLTVFFYNTHGIYIQWKSMRKDSA